MTRTAAITAALLFAASGASGQTSADSTARFLEVARAAAEKYADRSVAVREGFRRVGPDFPGMGEHWVQPGRLVSGRFIAEAPPILTYATFGDSVVLTGLAYALPLGPGEKAPSFPGAGTWHDHSRSVDEESLLIAPLAAAHHGDANGDRPRLAMLHAWLWTPNPEGVFAQDNWALPYVRAGLPAPPSVEQGAARALSLLNGGDAYQLALLRAAARLSEAEAAHMKSIIADHTGRIREWHDRVDAGEVVSDAGSRYLSAAWGRLWADLLAAASPEAAQQLRRFADPHAGH